jgi:hypothetical protein
MLEKFTNNVKKVVGVGAIAVGSMASSPADASIFVGPDGQPQSDGGRGTSPEKEKSMDVAKSLQPSLNAKFAQQLASKDFSNIEVHLKPGVGNDKTTFIINIFHKTTHAGRVIEVDIDKSMSGNKYAMDALLSGAISKELEK